MKRGSCAKLERGLKSARRRDAEIAKLVGKFIKRGWA